MKLTLTFDLPDRPGVTPTTATLVLTDALAEFVATRTPIDEYVERRYAGQYPKFAVAKRNDVERRVETAERIRHAVFLAAVEE